VAASAVKTYRVRRGDTLVKIMRREWSRDDPELLKALLAANPRVASNPDLIRAGDVLNIPVLLATGSATLAAPAEQGDEPSVASRFDVGGRPNANNAARARVRWYTIRKRDSLASIARRLLHDEKRWPEIAKLNRLSDPHKILPGLQIMLPPASSDT
jgi:nucleoid-associated protein YgaU